MPRFYHCYFLFIQLNDYLYQTLKLFINAKHPKRCTTYFNIILAN
ncbi:hypothetical protein FM106_28605 [Brachybacterium faecium]|nr:hypothetical protein FM106_28605 [Brachybacterium faecium]